MYIARHHINFFKLIIFPLVYPPPATHLPPLPAYIAFPLSRTPQLYPPQMDNFLFFLNHSLRPWPPEISGEYSLLEKNLFMW